MSEQKDPVERALEVLVYAPIGAGAMLFDMAPGVLNMLVARGRAEVDRRQEDVNQRVQTARSLGQVVLAFGVPMVRERVQRKVADLTRRGASTVPDAEPARGAPVAPRSPAEPAPLVSVPSAPSASVVDAPDRGELPIPGYDALSASQVVERLTGLSPEELDAVFAYEAAHRQRRTILGKIEQLAG